MDEYAEIADQHTSYGGPPHPLAPCLRPLPGSPRDARTGPASGLRSWPWVSRQRASP